MYIQICNCVISVWEIRWECKTKKAREKNTTLSIYGNYVIALLFIYLDNGQMAELPLISVGAEVTWK